MERGFAGRVSAAPGGERDQCLTGVVFSLTIVSLQLASSQFGPRLLRTFMTSRANQLVLGYRHLHLLPDRRWYRAGKLEFVPQLSIAAAFCSVSSTSPC